MEHRNDIVQGDRLRWARTQQGLTLRWIHKHDGPSLGYLSEIENGKKTEVHSDVLLTLTRLLRVTPAFVRGQVPRFDEHPAACRGLAGEVAVLVRENRADLPDWTALEPMERARQVLCLIARKSPKLPRVVLAWVLNLELDTLDGIMTGTQPLMKELLLALEELTTLPAGFFQHGLTTGEHLAPMAQPVDEEYQAVIRDAKEKSITPSQLRRLLDAL